MGNPRIENLRRVRLESVKRVEAKRSLVRVDRMPVDLDVLARMQTLPAKAVFFRSKGLVGFQPMLISRSPIKRLDRGKQNRGMLGNKSLPGKSNVRLRHAIGAFDRPAILLQPPADL